MTLKISHLLQKYNIFQQFIMGYFLKGKKNVINSILEETPCLETGCLSKHNGTSEKSFLTATQLTCNRVRTRLVNNLEVCIGCKGHKVIFKISVIVIVYCIR